MSNDEKIDELLHAQNISVSVFLNTVKIEIECGGDYEAQVLFEDLIERLQDGQEISITPTRPDRGFSP